MNPLLMTNFEACTKCTICTEYCPVSEVRPAYPGPKQSGPDGERQRLKDAAFYNKALKYCSNCKRCEIACPSNVRIGDVIALARKRFAGPNLSPRDAILAHTDFMGTMATMVAPIVNYVTNIPLTRFFLDKIVGIPAWRIFPKYSWTTFRAWYFNNRPDQTQFAEQVTLFHGCFINFNNPSLGQDSIRLLNALGVGVRLLARERCCGVPLISSGFFGHAKDNALSNAKNIAQALTKTERVVCPSSTCSMTLRNEYPDILEVKNDSWRDRMDLLIRHVYRLMEKGRELNFQRQEIKVAYHTACHMEKLGWSAYSIKLLKLIPGLQLTILPSRCCGIAGTYGFKKENSEYSQKIGAPLFQSIRDSGCDLVVSECETCKMQIQMSTGVPCENPVTILARNLV